MDVFRTTLERIRFNTPTWQLIIDNGFTNIGSLATVSDAGVTEIIKYRAVFV